MKIDIRPTRPDERHMRPYDYSTLSAVNRCPTFAVLRYSLHKVWSKSSRSLSLEAGQACHDVFASERLWRMFQRRDGACSDIAIRRGRELFGEVRWEQQAPLLIHSDERNERLKFCLKALETSGYYDDPSDRRRTLSNIEQSCIAYLDRLDTRSPVWVRDLDDPNSDCGIELPFDLVVTINDGKPFRFVGRIDGVHSHYETGELWIGENKTASRLDLSWIESFRMSHQVTGYMLAGTTLCGSVVRNGFLLGTAIPQPKSYDFGGVIQEVVTRNDEQFAQWAEWASHTIGVYEACDNDPVVAPKYSHSCNAYFRSCMFIPYCAGTLEDKNEIMSFLEEDHWSPLDHLDGKAGD